MMDEMDAKLYLADLIKDKFPLDGPEVTRASACVAYHRAKRKHLYAATAMGALLANGEACRASDLAEAVARAAFKVADAMLAAEEA